MDTRVGTELLRVGTRRRPPVSKYFKKIPFFILIGYHLLISYILCNLQRTYYYTYVQEVWNLTGLSKNNRYKHLKSHSSK